MNSHEAHFLALAAGPEQLPAIRIAKKNKWQVIAFDQNPEAPGLREADISYSFDAMCNLPRVLDIARTAKVKALLPIPLGAMLQAAGEVNEHLGLRGISCSAARFSTDKLLQRNELRQSGLPQPHSVACDSPSEIHRAALALKGPGLVKPRFGSGSSGVFLFENTQQIDAHLAWHIQSLSPSSIGAGPRSLVEECIHGIEFGVDAVVVRNEFTILAIRQKDMTPLPFRLSKGLYSPPDISKQLLAKIESACRKAAFVLGFSDCMIHFDVMATEDSEPTIIETSGRPSGFHISAVMLPAILGYSPLEQLMRSLLDLPFDFTPHQSKAAVLRMLESTPGIVVAIKGLSEARRSPGVVSADTFLKPGDAILRQDSGCTGFKVGYIITQGATLQEARESWAVAAKHVMFELA
jgi:biotin carboxylase